MSRRVVVTIECDLCDRAVSWTNPRTIGRVREYARRKRWACGVLNGERYDYCPNHASTLHHLPYTYLPEDQQPYNRRRRRSKSRADIAQEGAAS